MWVELFFYLFLTIYIYKAGGRRGLFSLFGHLGIIRLIPAILGDWLSVIFISFPLLAIYYYAMYRMAEIIIPFANPDDNEEAKKHFWVLFWYSWGLQYPLWVVADHAGQNIEERVRGKFTRKYGIGIPGIIWARSHHAVGITQGFQFSRVAGPGIVFTHRHERPDKIIDLRTQIRSSKIQALTKDGVPFKAILVIVFSVDREHWPTELYNNLVKANPMLEGGMNTNHTVGSYPFSSQRVLEVIKLDGALNPLEKLKFSEISWDIRVLRQVEIIARRVLSQRELNELWSPRNTNEGSSAIVEISEEILNKASAPLRKQGICLYAGRIVNFEFTKGNESKEDEISKQQLTVWSTHWRDKADQTLEAAKSKASLEAEKVRAKIAEARFRVLEESKDPIFARKVIAWRLLTALADSAKHEPVPTGDKPPETFDGIFRSVIDKRLSEMFPDMFLQMKDFLFKGKK